MTKATQKKKHSQAGKKGAMKRKGESGAAKNYMTRNQALKKLQVTLSDFRRLCILKGIYPREPRSRKKANKGSTAPTTFYYLKDIAYLQHEPVLHKLREHKAFAKKLSRALGRGQEGLAKNLEARHEGYRIDHIIKERYPTFADSIRDLDDALCLIVLFAHLPATPQLPAAVVANCTRLAAEWQLYVMRTRALRKAFLSIKGIYFQAEIGGQRVTWLVPYAFTQRIPPDVDFRIMLTFLELYQTLLGFVFFKLFTDTNLVYPPKLDTIKDEAGAGIGALLLEESSPTLTKSSADGKAPDAPNHNLSARDVRKQIRQITTAENVQEEEQTQPAFTAGTSTSTTLDAFPQIEGALPAPIEEAAASLFEPYSFYISREATRPVLEFVIRSFGGRVGWDPILGDGSIFREDDPRITHHIVDRPVSAGHYSHPGKRAYVQPQWVIDCINARRLLPTEEYGPGKTLPPHLSPFIDDEQIRQQGGYVPEAARTEAAGIEAEESATDTSSEEEATTGEDQVSATQQPGLAMLAAAQNPDDEALLYAAEVEAEKRGTSHAQFQVDLAAARKNTAKPSAKSTSETDKDKELAEIMLTGKRRKLYQKMAYSKTKKAEECAKLEAKKKALKTGKAKRSGLS